MKKISFRKISFSNPFVRLRRFLTVRYLQSTAASDVNELSFHWQPAVFVLVKVLVVAYLSYRADLFYPHLGDLIRKGFEFFKLEEIYNFKFPSKSFFDRVAEIIFLFIILYYGMFFLIRQIQALFSSFILNLNEKKAYYIKNLIIFKNIHVIQIAEIDHIVLKQNILGRLIHIGTIVLEKKSGEKIIIRSLNKASDITKQLAEMRQ